MSMTLDREPIGIKIEGLDHSFGSQHVLKGIDVELAPGTITGLVGRNGVGKTTLLSLMAAHLPAQSGTITVDGAPVWENPANTSRICLIKEKNWFIANDRITETLKFHETARPTFSRAYAEGLMDRFEIPRKKYIEKLSTGQRSALGGIIGLASRAPLTLLDEVHLGMDAVARRMFYQELMDDYIAHPRTIVISSHLLDEIEELLEYVVILVDGRIAAAGYSDDVREAHSTPGRLASLTDVLIELSMSEKDAVLTGRSVER